MRLQRVFLVAVIVFTAISLQTAHAQVAASIAGIVTDASGAPISAAAVTAKNLETGALRTATTDDAGRYLILSLVVGQYELRATKAGFREAIRTGVNLAVAQEARVDVPLQVGTIETQVSVTSDAPLWSPPPATAPAWSASSKSRI